MPVSFGKGDIRVSRPRARSSQGLRTSALLFAFSVGFPAATFSEGPKANTEVPILVHRRVGSKPCELVQRASLVIAEQYAWVEIEGEKSETYSPELGRGDYLSASSSISGRVAKDVHKSGFELRSESMIPANLPTVRAFDGDTPCPDLQSAIGEVGQAREQRRTKLQGRVFTGLDDIVPAMMLQEEAAKPDQNTDPNTSTSAGAKTKFRGTVVLEVLIDAEGNVKQSKVVQSRGPELDKKAAEYVARWKFAPARKKGLPVPSVLPVVFNFNLHQ
jgi:TonB family protein